MHLLLPDLPLAHNEWRMSEFLMEYIYYCLFPDESSIYPSRIINYSTYYNLSSAEFGHSLLKPYIPVHLKKIFHFILLSGLESVSLAFHELLDHRKRKSIKH